jgi:methyl coenzyme M reductase beta subunit
VPETGKESDVIALGSAIEILTVGGVLSVIVTEALTDELTFPAKSFAKAYSVFAPIDEKVWVVGAEAPHEHPALSLVSTMQYGEAASAVSSVIVKVVMFTVTECAVPGIAKAVTTGGVVSAGTPPYS